MDARILPLLAPFVASGLVACTPDKDGTEDPVEVVDTGDPDSDPTVDSDSTGDSDAPTDSDPSADTGCTPAEDLWGDRVVGSPDELLAVCGEMCEGVTLHGMLWVSGEAFDDLSSLSCLSGIDGDLIIDGPTALTDLHGLPAAIIQRVELTDELGIDDLAMDPATAQVGQLWMSGVADSSMAGMASVQVSELDARDMPALRSLEGPDWPATMDSVIVAQAPELEDLSGLEGVTTLRYGLALMDNTALRALDGLDGLEQVDEWVQVTDNTALPTDEIEAFLARITVSGTTTVSGNGP